MKRWKIAAWLVSTLAILLLAACGGGGGSDDGTATDSSATGTLSLSMVDAPGADYQAVYVTIQEVQVCRATGECLNDAEACQCEWLTIATPHQTYNLLELVNGVMATLAQEALDPGTYNQMRLLLEDTPDDGLNIFGDPHPYAQYLIDMQGEAHEMKVPSGYQSGIKLVHPFEIESNVTTELILDFDVARSVVKAGKSGQYLLKPTIKITGTSVQYYVSGTVRSSGAPSAALADAQVTAWYLDSADIWQTAAGTLTDDSGNYRLYLAPGPYVLVVTADGYGPECTDLTVEADQSYVDIDFALSTTQMVTVTGTITGTAAQGLDDPPIVAISFSQVGDCFPEPIEIALVQATDDDDDATPDIFYNSVDGSFQYTYSIDLPAGLYEVTAATDGLEPVTEELDATDAVELDLDF